MSCPFFVYMYNIPGLFPKIRKHQVSLLSGLRLPVNLPDAFWSYLHLLTGFCFSRRFFHLLKGFRFSKHFILLLKRRAVVYQIYIYKLPVSKFLPGLICTPSAPYCAPKRGSYAGFSPAYSHIAGVCPDYRYCRAE